MAVFTNLTNENLHAGGGIGPPETMEEHLDVMAGLFRRLSDPDVQRAVVNVDGGNPGISVDSPSHAPKPMSCLFQRINNPARRCQGRG